MTMLVPRLTKLLFWDSRKTGTSFSIGVIQ
jgi:hypothetical protein